MTTIVTPGTVVGSADNKSPGQGTAEENGNLIALLTGVVSEIDEQLAKQGLTRNIAVRVPHFFAALEIIARTDFMILLPANFIRRYVDLDRFSVLDVPFQIPTIDISMFWHARMHHDPLHKWFREFVYQTIYSHPRAPKPRG